MSEPQRLEAVFEGGDVKAAMALFREMTEAILRNPASSERSVMTARFMKLAFPPFIEALEQLKGDACGNTEHVVDVATHCIAQCLANLFGTLVPLDRNWDAVADLLRRTTDGFASMSEKMMNLNADRKAAH